MGASWGDAPSTARSVWTATAEQFARYQELFDASARSSREFVEPDEAKEVLERSGLPHSELAVIWRLCDLDGDNKLSLMEFSFATHLVAQRRLGAELPAELPPELFASWSRQLSSASDGRAGCGVSTNARTSTAAVVADTSLQRQHVDAAARSSDGASVWSIDPEQLESYRCIFVDAAQTDPTLLGPNEARELFDRSELPHEELSIIWSMSDVDGDGSLTFPEFACAMHLVTRRRQGYTLPPDLPPDLVSSASCIADNPRKNDMRCSGRGCNDSVGRDGGGAAIGDAGFWAVGAEEMQSYWSLFQTRAMPDNRIDQAAGREIFESTRLPEELLAQIWYLSDVDQDGSLVFPEFACAMAMLRRCMDGAPPPVTLPADLAQLAHSAHSYGMAA